MIFSNERMAELMAQRGQLGEEYLEQGKDEGWVWANMTGYTSLRYAALICPINPENGARYDDVCSDSTLGRYWFEQLLDLGICPPAPESRPLSRLGCRWLCGWFHSVRSYWNRLPSALRE